MILVFEVLLGSIAFALNSHFPGFRRWHGGGFGFMSIVYSVLYLLTATYFARTESFASFWKGFGLDHKPSNYVWFGIVAALVLRSIGHFMLIHGWGKGVPNYNIIGFKNTLGPERFFYLVPLLLAAFLEEPVMRGFLYKAFRSSYSVATSMVLIVGVTAWTHWSQFHYGSAVIVLSSFTIVLCYLREKSDSLWDCIFCHLAFNASILFLSGVLQ